MVFPPVLIFDLGLWRSVGTFLAGLRVTLGVGIR